MKRNMALFLILVLLILLSTPALAGEKPVLTIGKAVDISAMTFPDGQDVENNYYIDYAEYKSGVDIQFAWCLADDAQRISLAIASNTMPDVMIVDQTVFTALVENDLIMDLTELYNTYAKGTTMNEIYDIFPESLNAAMIDGKLMAFPNTMPQYSQGVCWIRQDWLKKLNLDSPQTLDDLVNVLRAFKEKDPDGNGETDTIGLAASGEFITAYANAGTLGPLFNYFGSYPRIWYENEAGEVVYGSVTPETREALAFIQKLYAEKLIDPEFAVREVTEPVVSGKGGVIFGDWSCTLHILKESYLYDGADWNAYVCPVGEDGLLRTRFQAPATQYLVVNKTCKNPEAVVDILNASYNHMWEINVEPEWQAKFDEYENYSVLWQAIPIALQFERTSIVQERYAAFDQYVKEGSREGNSTAVNGFIDSYEEFLANPSASSTIGGWSLYVGCYIGGGAAVSEKNVYETPVFWGSTPTMDRRWTDLLTMEEETIIKIVLGESDISAFDTFVSDWYALGGEEITNEIAEAVGK